MKIIGFIIKLRFCIGSVDCSGDIPVPSGGEADSPSCGNKSGSVVAIRCHNSSEPTFGVFHKTYELTRLLNKMK